MDILRNDIEDWMVDYKKASVKPSTYDRLVGSLALMDRYPISTIMTDKLQVVDIQRYINKLLEDGYALTTIKKQLHLISGFIEHANLVGLLSRPLHKGVKLPSEATVKKHRRQVIAYTRD